MDKVLHLSMTFGGGAWDQHLFQTMLFRPGDTENKVINLYPEVTYQTFEGFGGVITEAAGTTYNQMDERQKQALMEAYFGKERMNYQFIRLPIDSCDFSLGQYEASSQPDFSDFSLERVKKNLWPMLDDAEKTAGRKLKLILSPWSPPAYMKTNGTRDHGGKLKPEYEKLWAEYLCRYIREYRLDDQIMQILLEQEPVWNAKNIEFDLDCEEITYHGAEALIYHVWSNLIGNAVKYSPEGGKVSISLNKENGSILFHIRDQGPGIAETDIRHIFEKFYQADTDHKKEGNGLGLAQVKQILDLLGGTVSVQSDGKTGSEFTVILPEI